MNTPCSIYNLSDELLSAIVEALIIEPKGAVPNLKALRLSSSRFAHLYPIPKFLFANIQLVADAEHLHRLPQDDLDGKLSLVKKVTFVAPSIFSKIQLGLMSGRSQVYKQHEPRLWTPSVDDAVFVEPPEDWIINLENFRTTLLQKPIRRLAKHPWTQTWQYAFFNARSSEVDKPQELPVEFRDSHLDGQVRTELEKNHEDAQAAKDLLLGDDIKGAWTNALRALPHVHTWRVATRSKEARFPIRVFDQRPNSMKPPEYHGKKYRCHIYDEDLGDALFAAAIRSLSEANLRLHEFNVDCVMTGNFRWERLRGWQQLDLSHLQNFQFQPALDFWNEDFNETEWEGNISTHAANAIAAVLRKCKDSLQELTCKGDCPLQWPGSEIISLPELRCLVLQGCWVRPLNLGRWMARMPRLQNLDFELPMVCENDYSDFRSILDAVKNQSKGMRLRLLTWWTVAIDLDYHTHDVERILGEKEDEDDSENVNRNLALYLSGKMDWNPSWLDND